ncbi:MAG: alanyl-tRNA editing protein [Anaerolineae bacterium]|nr:alanyl-tRNA editing protein [Anaerolineae bacterium]
MTRKVFWENPYLTGLDTHITGVHGGDVTVAETILYAFAGGQESDTGSIGGKPVLAARKDGLEIFYTLDESHSFRVGDPVRLSLDWERRYRLMRLHFAAELILELTYRTLPGVEKIGAHIAQDKSRIDFAWGETITAIFPALQEQAHGLIAADHPIISAYSDAANERRYWEIAGFARVSCGGTHLHTTGEVGRLDLQRKNIGKGKERIEIYLVD